MNSQRKQIIILSVMGVVLVGVLFYQLVIKGTSPTGPSSAAAKQAAPAADKPAADSPAGKSAEQQQTAENVDLYALLATIQEVDFDYENQRIPRDVMAPLVGKVAVRPGEEGGFGAQVAPATLGKVMSKLVSGIVWDESFPVAVVDNEVVEVGYEYADGTIVEDIEEDYVVFRVGESLIEVELKER